MQRHDVESVVSAGASPAASTIFTQLKPQETGTGLLIRFGEVATTSGSTISNAECKMKNAEQRAELRLLTVHFAFFILHLNAGSSN